MNAIFERASVRKYTDEPVAEEDIRQMMRAAMAAPSAANQQPWEFYIVRQPEMIEKLSKATPFTKPTKGAPLAIVPCIRKEGLKVPTMIDQDMGACVENILLEAVELGLGAVWQGIHPDPSRVAVVRELLSAPETLDPFCIIAVGHPDGEINITGPARYDESRIHWD